MRRPKISGLTEAFESVAVTIVIWLLLASLGNFQPWIETRLTQVAALDPAAPLLVLVLVLTAVLYALTRAFPSIDRWAASLFSPDHLTRADGILLLLPSCAVVYALATDAELAATAQFGSMLCVVLLTLRAAIQIKRTKEVPPQSPLLFSEVLQHHGLEPLPDLSRDELGRERLLQLILEMTAAPGAQPLTVGIEGAWGAGKTTLLNALELKLHNHSLSVLRMDLWHYREPQRVVEAYFSSLNEALNSTPNQPQLPWDIRRLAAGLADFTVGPIAAALRIASRPRRLSADRQRFADILMQRSRPLVVLLDDLDRLEQEELQAVLRAVKLIGELPNIRQVLAYDRDQIYRLLPHDKTQARDYIGKVVNFELSLSPPMDLALRQLSNTIETLEAALDPEAQAEFTARLSQSTAKSLVRMLATPRELRRITAHCALLWQSMREHVNFTDLLVLTAVQYRFPWHYSYIRSRPEVFSTYEWSGDPMLIFEDWREALLARKRQFFESLRESATEGEQDLLPLLSLLFPGEDDVTETSPTPQEAVRTRRICHPSIFDRYFTPFVPSWVVSEAEIERVVSTLRSSEAGPTRRRELQLTLTQLNRDDRFDSFLEQWQNLSQWLLDEPLEPSIAKDLAAGFASVAGHLSYREGFAWASQRRRAAFVVMDLVKRTANDEDATEVIVAAIAATNSPSFATDLLFYVVHPDRGRGVYGERQPSLPRVQAAFDEVIRSLLPDSGRLPQLPFEDIGSLFLASPEIGAPLLLGGLASNPQLLPQILRQAAPTETAPRYGRIVSERFDPAQLPAWLDLNEVDRLTNHLSIEEWDDPDEQEVVRRFRRYLAQADATGLEPGE